MKNSADSAGGRDQFVTKIQRFSASSFADAADNVSPDAICLSRPARSFTSADRKLGAPMAKNTAAASSVPFHGNFRSRTQHQTK